MRHSTAKVSLPAYPAPWTGRSPQELLKNILNQPLKFPPEKAISEEFKDLLTGCLQHDESKRLSWEEIYHHPLVRPNF